MADGRIVYIKNESQKEKLRGYGVKENEFEIMKGNSKGLEDILPMVCITKEGKEQCETGQKGIDLLVDQA
jgi:hypothetical protein